MSTATPSLRERTGGLTDVPAVWWAIGAILLDRTITLPFWGFEANPIVAGMGQAAWIVTSAVLIVGLLVAWYPLNARRSRFGHSVAVTIALAHTVVAMLNLSVVLGVV